MLECEAHLQIEQGPQGWKRRDEILDKLEIVQCSPNWGQDSTILIILNCAPGLPGKDREG